MERKRHSKILQRERVRPQRLRVEPPPGVAGVDGALLALKIFTDQVKSLVDDAERILNDVACNQARVLHVTPLRKRSRQMARPTRVRQIRRG